MSDKFIPLSVPNLKGNELQYVTTAVKTEWVSTGGPYVDDFEKKIAEYVKCKGAVSCQNGTSGLHTALMVLGVTRDDVVLVPTLTFIAAVNPVSYIGAEPVFMDCDDSLCMDPVKLREFCEEECDFVEGKLITKNTKKHVKALVVVHVFGNMADMVSIVRIAKEFNILILEDATEAIGTYYTEGEYVDFFAGTIGDMGVFSFNGNKIMTTGGGGMIVSNNETYLNKAKHITTQAKADTLYYTHDEIGYNYRMTNLQAALGLGQLEQLEAFIKTKTDNYEYYKHRMENIDGLSLLPVRKGIRSNHWFYAVVCDNKKFDRDSMIEKLGKQNIQTRPIWGLIHEQKPYLCAMAFKIDKANEYWKKVVNVPCSTNLTLDEVDIVMDAIEKIGKE